MSTKPKPDHIPVSAKWMEELFTFGFEIVKRAVVVAAVSYAVLRAVGYVPALLSFFAGFVFLALWSTVWLIKTEKSPETPNGLFGRGLLYIFYSMAIFILSYSLWVSINQHEEWKVLGDKWVAENPTK